MLVNDVDFVVPELTGPLLAFPVPCSETSTEATPLRTRHPAMLAALVLFRLAETVVPGLAIELLAGRLWKSSRLPSRAKLPYGVNVVKRAAIACAATSGAKPANVDATSSGSTRLRGRARERERWVL